jgi:phosphoglycolate phosphatase
MSGTILVLDVDNTLYDFVDFFGPSFRSMVHALSRTEKIPESEIVRSARSVYQGAGTLDYRLLIENMDIFQDRPAEDIVRLIHLARVAFSRTRNTRLKLYDGMGAVLWGARAAGFKSICVTNAPYYEVTSRLRRLNVLGLIDGLIAWEGRAADEEKLEVVNSFQERRSHLEQRFDIFWTTNRQNLKPSPSPFLKIRDRYGHSRAMYSIGDSIAKDLDPAKKAGMTTIWARYGTHVDQRNLQTVLEVTPWTAGEIALASERPCEPDYVVDSPRQIAKLLRIPLQADLFTGDA